MSEGMCRKELFYCICCARTFFLYNIENYFNKICIHHKPMYLYAMYSKKLLEGILSSRSVFINSLVATVSVILLTFNLSVGAQSYHRIHGIIKNTNDSLVMGNALLLSRADSSLIKGVFFLNGFFEVNNPTNVDVLLKISVIGYKDTILSVLNTEVSGDLGVIYLQDKLLQLDAVTVTANAPHIKRSVEGVTTANIENTILSSSTTPLEVLAKLPNLLVEENRVSVVGKGEALIYLDGKQVSMSQVVALSVSQISKVEIINNPSAKYDAEGKAVINIISIEDNHEGFQGKLMQRSTWAKHPLSYTSSNLNWRKGKWSVVSDYGIKFGKDWGTNLLTREVLGNGLSSKFINDFEDNSQSKYVANYRLGSKYQIDKSRNVTIEYLGSQNIKNQDSKAITSFIDPSDYETIINAKTTGALNNQSNALNLNYYQLNDTLGSNMFFGGQYSSFFSDDESFIDETIEKNLNNTFETQLNKSFSNITFATAQLDVEKNYLPRGKFNYGAKFIHAKNTGKIDFFTKHLIENKFIQIPDLSNDFEYSENISAAYMQYSKKMENNLNYTIGIRGEYTDAKGNSKNLSQTIIDTAYLNFFPDVSIQLPINKKIKLGISYSSRINRPSYQDIDPFLFYVDSLTSKQGNPELQPEYIYSIESSLSMTGYTFTFGYTYTRDAFRYVMIGGGNGPNSTILKQVNMQSENSYFISLTIPFSYKKFSSYNVIGATLDQILDNRPEFRTVDFTPRPYLYSKNSLLIDKIGEIELNVQYMGTRFDGIFYRKPFYTVSMGWSRAFLNKKLHCSFLINDMLKSFEVDGYYKLASSKVSYLRKFNSYYYHFTLSYNFGKLKEVNYKSQNVGEDADKRIQK